MTVNHVQSDSQLTEAAETRISFGVVVLNWNNVEETMRCVEALDAADEPPQHVVVVDNGSSDNSVERLEEWADAHWIWRLSSAGDSDADEESAAPWLIIARSGANRGFAGGNNVGIRYLQQRTNVTHILLINNDAVVEPAFFSEIAGAIKQNRGAGLLTGTIYEDPDRDRVWYAGGIETPLRALIQHKHDVPQEPDAVTTDFVSGCAMVISRPLLERLGLLAECYFPLYWEDGEYSRRARDAGFPVLYVPAAKVFHKGNATVGAANVSATVAHCQNRLRVFYVRRNYHGLLKAAALGYLAITKPGRAFLEAVKGRPKIGWAILRGTASGFVSSAANQ